MFFQPGSRYRKTLCRRALPALIFAIASFFSLLPENGQAQEADAGEFDVAMNEALALVRSTVWYNEYGDSVTRSVQFAQRAAELADANWGQQDLRFLQATSVYSVALSQHTLELISRAEGDVAASVRLVSTLTTEAGSIARTRTQDSELVMLATLVKARLARVTGDEEAARQLYDFVIQALELMAPPDHPVLVAVKSERG